MTIAVAYRPDDYGRAAVRWATAKAEANDEKLVAASLSVSDVVIDEAVDAGADRLVIGIRKRTPVGKMLMGRVTQMILLDAPMPVIAVKP